MGVDWEVSTEEGGVAGRLGKVLSCGTSGSAIVWSGEVVAIGANVTYVRGSSYGFPATGNQVKASARKILQGVETQPI